MDEPGEAVIPRAATDGLMRTWASLFHNLEVEGVTAAGARLVEAYGQPHRHYHNLRHLTEVLAHIDELAPGAQDADHVRLAAWFHDVVYDPTRRDNEETSSTVALEVLGGLRMPAASCAAVARLVQLTATHDPAPGDGDGAVLCDADLAVLGSEPARYDEYSEGVRREYAHLPAAVFAAGRADVLGRLMGRDALFRTAAAQLRWEARARANMRRELERLSQARLDVPDSPGFPDLPC